MLKIQEDLQFPSDWSQRFKHQHHLLLPGMRRNKQFCFQVADPAPSTADPAPSSADCRAPERQQEERFLLSYWCAISGLRRESICFAASNGLPFASSGTNASTYHGNGDTIASLLAHSQVTLQTHLESPQPLSDVTTQLNETDFCMANRSG